MKILMSIITMVEFILLAGIYKLESLAYQKAGVNHHLYFKKNEYMHKYLTQTNLKILAIVFIASIVIGILLLIFKAKNKVQMINSSLVIFWSGFSLYTVLSLSEKLVYPYMILAGCICILLAYINVCIAKPQD